MEKKHESCRERCLSFSVVAVGGLLSAVIGFENSDRKKRKKVGK